MLYPHQMIGGQRAQALRGLKSFGPTLPIQLIDLELTASLMTSCKEYELSQDIEYDAWLFNRCFGVGESLLASCSRQTKPNRSSFSRSDLSKHVLVRRYVSG